MEEELSDLHSFNFGLMPLTDDVWSRGKCGFTLPQYMAVGLPVVYSPMGMDWEIVVGDEWLERLTRLVTNQELRIKWEPEKESV